MPSNILFFDKVHLLCLLPGLVDLLQHLRLNPLQLTDSILDQRRVELNPVPLDLRISEPCGHIDRAFGRLSCSRGVREPLIEARLGRLWLLPVDASQFFYTGAPLFSHS